MGRHSAPDDSDDSEGTAAVLSVLPASSLPAASDRPRPGRHTGERPASRDDADDADDADDSAPEGLDVIETVMAVEAETDPAAELDTGADTDAHTAQIQPIVDPVLDEPLPNAVTTLITPVVDGQTPPPRPAPTLAPDPRPAPEPGSSEQPGSDQTADNTAENAIGNAADTAADKADGKAEGKAADKAAAKAARAEAKAAKAEAKATAKATAQRPHPDRVSDLALLRTDSAARARVIAAIVVPFVLYVGVLLVLGAFDLRTVLIWIWVPLISAGVVAGLLLDLAHRAAAARAIADLEPSREPASPG